MGLDNIKPSKDHPVFKADPKCIQHWLTHYTNDRYVASIHCMLPEDIDWYKADEQAKATQ
jgi:hypothetical protein